MTAQYGVVPKRIQLRRTKGWRKPEGVVVVSRPSKWGNPFVVGRTYNGPGFIADNAAAVAAFRAWIGMNDYGDDPLDFEELRGRDLACWCPLDQSCHADVLLEIANGPVWTAAPSPVPNEGSGPTAVVNVKGHTA